MLDELFLTCDAIGCDRQLDAEDPALEFSSPAAERRAYVCECGAVTMTVSNPS
jgi:hypothetical protein